MSDLYNGETYDARLELPGWDAPGYDAGAQQGDAWQGVRKLDHGKEMLIAQDGPAIIRNEELKPVKLIRTPAGETVFDFGQNMVGWVRLKVAGAGGHDGDAAPRRGARPAGQLLHDQPAHAPSRPLQYTLKGGRRRDLRAALHLHGLPVRRGGGLAR